MEESSVDSSGGLLLIGKTPARLKGVMHELQRTFVESLSDEDRRRRVHHEWVAWLGKDTKALVKEIGSDPFWLDVLPSGARVVPVHDIDEMYYSRAPKSTGAEAANVYGMAGNYDLHVDGRFRIPGVRLFRVLIGLVPNEEVATSFPAHERRHALTEGEFVVFDFDRTYHQVVRLKPPVDDTKYRVMLKLHFCVFESNNNHMYDDFVIGAYTAYEKVTRHTMNVGTDPTTFASFFVGLFCQYYTRHPAVFAGLQLLLAASVCLRFFPQTRFIAGPLAVLLAVLFIAFCYWALFFWLRWIFSGYR